MRPVNAHHLYRIIDANFNRAKEGLRVCEDIARFFLNQRGLTRQYKLLRHQVTEVIFSYPVSLVIKARDVKSDVGRRSQRVEFKRNQVADIFYANSQRVKESLRVLEEFSKLLGRKSVTARKKDAESLKRIRYRLYALEQKMSAKL